MKYPLIMAFLASVSMPFSFAIAEEGSAEPAATPVDVSSSSGVFSGLRGVVSFGYTNGSYSGEFDSGTDFPGDGSGSANGVFLGAALGYDFDLKNSLIAGVELAFQASNASGAESCPNEDFDCGFEFGPSLALRGRVGYLVDPDLLVYGSVGAVAARIKTEAEFLPTSESRTDSSTAFGYELGLGVEYQFQENVAIRGALTYRDLGSESFEVYDAEFDLDADAAIFEVGIVFGF